MRAVRWLARVLFILAGCFPLTAYPDEPAAVVINGVEFVRIPPGAFWYPVWVSNPDRLPIGRPIYRDVRVWLDAYYIARFEARASDFERFINAQAIADLPPVVVGGDGAACGVERQTDGRIALPERFRRQDGRPATNLSWTMADAFARWMGFRLPTEAEWIKAGRGTDDKRVWPWGDEFPDDTFGHFALTDPCVPAPVNSHPKGRSPYGIHHMAGNVAEWVSDWYSEAFDASLVDGARNPAPAASGTILSGADSPRRIEKGGRWGAMPEVMAIPRRALFGPHYYNGATGVRFAIDASLVTEHLRRGTATTVK